jgi:hypothetical protein
MSWNEAQVYPVLLVLLALGGLHTWISGRSIPASNILDGKALGAGAAPGGRDDGVASIKADVRLVKWMIGFVLVFQIAITFKLFVL